MKKDFDRWNKLQQKISARNLNLIFKKGQIWWCTLGLNIGSEQNGVGHNLERPVLIIKKYTHNTCLILPLTTKNKIGNYYYKINMNNSIILCQPRLIDSKRLTRQIKHRDISKRELFLIIHKFKNII